MLALAQCRTFVARLCQAEPALETRELQVVTTGDRITDRPLADIGGKGLFVKEIEEALLDRRADFAVHSIKDVPGSLPDGLLLACIPRREDPRDVLVAPRHEKLEALPQGARVGTSSLRRMLSLKARRPDLEVVPLRGNVDTRLRKVDAGECDAIVLARAGLVRLGLEGRATELLSP
ncbi:MAG TPA: hydroxymethylbilane synthase, partial [Polyangiaceae bacterium]